MPKITIYTTPICSYCHAAKALLQRKKVAYEEIDVSADRTLRSAMAEKSGGRHTVPQIFIGERHVGGYDDLSALDRQGGLDPLLAG